MIAKVIGKAFIALLLLFPYAILVAMGSNWQFSLLIVGTFALYSWCLIWFYADLKARDRLGFWNGLLFKPFLITTGSIGLAIWFVFEPEARRRRWYRRDRQ